MAPRNLTGRLAARMRGRSQVRFYNSTVNPLDTREQNIEDDDDQNLIKLSRKSL